MATSTTKHDTTTTSPFELPSMQGATQQVQDLNERMIASSKTAALTALDTFEKALQVVGDMQQKAASATQRDWVSAATASQTKLMTDLSAPYASAVRDLLK